MSDPVTKLNEELKQEPELETGFDKAPPPPPVTTFGENNLPLALISDIDGTIAFMSMDDSGKPTRDFMDFSKSESDVPNQKVIGLIRAWYSLSESPTIYFVTNRTVAWRDVTVRWLIKFFPPSSYRWTLRMRPANDFVSSAAAVKEVHLVNEIVKKFSVNQVWEDDDDCILMYRSRGLMVLDAKETWPKS